jgi:hypothetical protein
MSKILPHPSRREFLGTSALFLATAMIGAPSMSHAAAKPPATPLDYRDTRWQRPRRTSVSRRSRP